MALRGDTASFRGYAPATWLTLDRLAATGPGDRALPVRAGVETVTVQGVTREVPSVQVAGLRPTGSPSATWCGPVRSKAMLMSEFTGQRFEFSGPQFAFVTGRNLFLLPRDASCDPPGAGRVPGSVGMAGADAVEARG